MNVFRGESLAKARSVNFIPSENHTSHFNVNKKALVNVTFIIVSATISRTAIKYEPRKAW